MESYEQQILVLERERERESHVTLTSLTLYYQGRNLESNRVGDPPSMVVRSVMGPIMVMHSIAFGFILLEYMDIERWLWIGEL